MICGLPYSGRDLDQTARLIRWMQCLGGVERDSILLVPARPVITRQRHFEIVDIAAKTFGKCYVHTPEIVDERGWPISCNLMFKETLFHVEHFFRDDLLFLEPDAVPTKPDWLAQIKRAWDSRPAGKEFMGADVRAAHHHMSGVAVYGRGWRRVAPSLAGCWNAGAVKQEPWDKACAPEILASLHATNLIQQIHPGPILHDLTSLKPATVIYHQNKTGELIRMLDQQLFGGRLYHGRQDILTKTYSIMTHYFRCENASKKIKAAGLEFVFEKVGQVGGAWRGVFATDREDEVAALLTLTPASGVTQITEEQYLDLTKKKAPSLRRFANSNEKPEIIRAPSAAIQDHARSAVVVEEPPVRPPDSIPASPVPVPATVEEILQLGEVNPPDDLTPVKPAKPRAKRKAT